MNRPFDYDMKDPNYSSKKYIENYVLNMVWLTQTPFPIDPKSSLNPTGEWILVLPYGFDSAIS